VARQWEGVQLLGRLHNPTGIAPAVSALLEAPHRQFDIVELPAYLRQQWAKMSLAMTLFHPTKASLVT
jgi:hypothetical protein